ncbi:MAG: hypothetical protein OXE50_15355 [Chloroflexi bacterium]|nr:hypothetical protein [Chloroflexota bacterium]
MQSPEMPNGGKLRDVISPMSFAVTVEKGYAFLFGIEEAQKIVETSDVFAIAFRVGNHAALEVGGHLYVSSFIEAFPIQD